MAPRKSNNYLSVVDEKALVALRHYELDAYAAVVTALRAEGHINDKKITILNDLREIFGISVERHKAEVCYVILGIWFHLFRSADWLILHIPDVICLTIPTWIVCLPYIYYMKPDMLCIYSQTGPSLQIVDYFCSVMVVWACRLSVFP